MIGVICAAVVFCSVRRVCKVGARVAAPSLSRGVLAARRCQGLYRPPPPLASLNAACDYLLLLFAEEEEEEPCLRESEGQQ